MAEEFQAAVCGGSWWMSPRTALNRSSCSSVIMDMENFGPFWPRDLMDMKSKSTDEYLDGSMVLQDIQKPSSMLPESAFQRMATAFSSSSPTTTSDWNQNLLFKVQEGVDTFLASGDDGSTTVVTEAEHQGLTMDQQQSLKFVTSSTDCTTFPISSTSYGYPSTLLQSLFDSNSPPPPSPPTPPPPPPQQQQQALYNLQSSNSNNFNFVQNLPSIRPKQQVPGSLHLTNNTPFWNIASVSPLHDDISSFFPSPQPQFHSSSYKEKKGCPNLTVKPNHQEIRDLGLTAKKNSGELPFKRPRLETPSPLPTFKVRKEKLGDRITALQQLVSPFGKTDTASVLHEAIEYIKLLHDQVNILSAPYTKNGPTKQLQQIHGKVIKDAEGQKQDLRSLGLCLVPVSSTFPVATEMATSFWAPSFEGSLR